MTRFGIAIYDKDVWVKEYDPDAEDETLLTFTDDPTEALTFGDRGDAVETLLRVSTERPSTREGRLNRPLRDEYDVEIRQIPEAA